MSPCHTKYFQYWWSSLSLSPNFGELSLLGDYVVKWSCSAFDRVNYVIFFPKKNYIKIVCYR